MKLIRWWFWASAILLTGCLTAQTPDIADQKIRIHLLESRMDSLRIQRSAQENKGKILAQEIELASRSEGRSLNEHRELEKLMRQSQKLDQDIRMSEQAIAGISAVHQSSVQTLVNDLQNLMDALMDSAKQAQNDSDRDQLLRQVNQVLAEKNQWESRILHQTGTSVSQFYVDINPWDNPEDIRVKRDVILDMEEAVRNEIKEMDRQIKSLRNEENMRRKMADLSGELNLFDETEETVNRDIAYRGHQGNQELFIDENQLGGNNVLPVTRDEGSWSENSKSFDSFYSESVYPPLKSEWENPASGDRTPLSLTSRLDIMARYRAHLISRADSLSLRAREFESRATQMDH